MKTTARNMQAPYTNEEKSYILKNFKKLPVDQIANSLGRSKSGITAWYYTNRNQKVSPVIKEAREERVKITLDLTPAKLFKLITDNNFKVVIAA